MKSVGNILPRVYTRIKERIMCLKRGVVVVVVVVVVEWV
jgi:hypothetical protein